MKKSLLIASLAVISMNVLGIENTNQESHSAAGGNILYASVQNLNPTASAQNQITSNANNLLFNDAISSIVQENQIYIHNTAQLINLCMQNEHLSKSIFDFFCGNIITLNSAFASCMITPETKKMYQVLILQNNIIREGIPKFLSDLMERINKLDSYLDSIKTEKENAKSEYLFLNEILWSVFQNNQAFILKNYILLSSFSDKVEYLNDPELYFFDLRFDSFNDLMLECNKSRNFAGEVQKDNDKFFDLLKKHRGRISNLQIAVIKTRDEYISDLLNQIAAMSFENLSYFEQKIARTYQPGQLNSESTEVPDGRDQASTSTAIYNEKIDKYEEPTNKSDKFESSDVELDSVEHKKDKGKRPYEDSEDETGDEFQIRVKRAK